MRTWIPTKWEDSEVFPTSTEGPSIEAMSGGSNYQGTKYAVRSGRCVLSKITLEWDYEPSPSNRDKAFFEEYRFDTFEEAVNAIEKFDKNHRLED